MPTLYDLKPRFQALLAPSVGWLASRGVTANQVTVTAAVLSIALGACLFFVRAAFLVLSLALLVRMALNAVDGMLARQYGQKSALGGLLNEVGDVISDAALYLPFAHLPGMNPALVVAAVFLGALTEFVGVCAVAIGSARRYDGPMGKSDRALVFGALGLWVGLGNTPGLVVNLLMAVTVALLLATCVNRARMAVREA